MGKKIANSIELKSIVLVYTLLYWFILYIYF